MNNTNKINNTNCISKKNISLFYLIILLIILCITLLVLNIYYLTPVKKICKNIQNNYNK